MVDDHWDARPQSGFTEASVVWQAPAEGGIPRYMMIFAEGDPPSVGPVRSARLYFVQWAAEWNAVYVHVGGSPQAMALLRAEGPGPAGLRRRRVPLGRHLPVAHDGPLRPAQRLLGREAAPGARRAGRGGPARGRRAGLAVRARRGARAPARRSPDRRRLPRTARSRYRYDRQSNTWRRYVNGKIQRDRANNRVVAPKNVVVMEVGFGLLGAGQKGRLEAANVGSGRAWIATNGTIVRGTWKKTSAGEPHPLLRSRREAGHPHPGPDVRPGDAGRHARQGGQRDAGPRPARGDRGVR